LWGWEGGAHRDSVLRDDHLIPAHLLDDALGLAHNLLLERRVLAAGLQGLNVSEEAIGEHRRAWRASRRLGRVHVAEEVAEDTHDVDDVECASQGYEGKRSGQEWEPRLERQGTRPRGGGGQIAGPRTAPIPDAAIVVHTTQCRALTMLLSWRYPSSKLVPLRAGLGND